MKLVKTHNNESVVMRSCECTGSGACTGSCSNSNAADAQNLNKKKSKKTK